MSTKLDVGLSIIGVTAFSSIADTALALQTVLYIRPLNITSPARPSSAWLGLARPRSAWLGPASASLGLGILLACKRAAVACLLDLASASTRPGLGLASAWPRPGLAKSGQTEARPPACPISYCLVD